MGLESDPTDRLHAELRRLHLARKDFASAEALLSLLESRSNFHGSQFGSVEEGLWTGIAVSYMRPFTESTLRIAREWECFEERPDLQERHDQMRVLRDKMFAHTDPASGREVLLMPLGSADEERGYVTEQRGTFSYGAIEDVRELFQFQRRRVDERVEQLVTELSSRRAWRMGDLAG